MLAPCPTNLAQAALRIAVTFSRGMDSSATSASLITASASAAGPGTLKSIVVASRPAPGTFMQQLPPWSSRFTRMKYPVARGSAASKGESCTTMDTAFLAPSTGSTFKSFGSHSPSIWTSSPPGAFTVRCNSTKRHIPEKQIPAGDVQLFSPVTTRCTSGPSKRNFNMIGTPGQAPGMPFKLGLQRTVGVTRLAKNLTQVPAATAAHPRRVAFPEMFRKPTSSGPSCEGQVPHAKQRAPER